MSNKDSLCSRLLHTQVSRWKRKREKKSVALEEGGNWNIGLSQKSTEIDEWRRPATCLTFGVFLTIQFEIHVYPVHWSSLRKACLLSSSFRAAVGKTHHSCGLISSQDAYRNTSKVGGAWLVLGRSDSVFEWFGSNTNHRESTFFPPGKKMEFWKDKICREE